jgi:hypothetical protein
LPRPRRRRGLPGSTLLLLVAAVALATGGCSAQPISQVSSAPEPAPASAPASAAGSSVAPGSGDPTSAAPPATATPVPAAAPPGKPTGTTFAIVSEQPADGGGVTQTHRVTWSAPQGEASSFLVFGVKDCLRASKQNNGTPCVVKGMRIPHDTLVQLAEVPGDQRSVDIAWDVPKSGKQPYAAVLIRATNSAGDSIFTIVHSEDVCWRC